MLSLMVRFCSFYYPFIIHIFELDFFLLLEGPKAQPPQSPKLGVPDMSPVWAVCTVLL